MLGLRLQPVEVASDGTASAPIAAGGSKPAFVAEYEKWLPVPREGGGPNYAGRRVRDRLELRLSRGGWAIDRLERLELGPVWE